MEIKIMKQVLEANEEVSRQIADLMAAKNILLLNMISSPGSGKTALLEKILASLGKDLATAVIEGDVQTDRDARRLAGLEIPITVINTQNSCHLDSFIVLKALKGLPLDDLDVVFIENVGNMVCPAEFDLGEDAKIAILSTPEGEDKPAKYPLLFTEASLVLLNKMDLLPYLPFDIEKFYMDLRQVNASVPVLETSAATGEGLVGWEGWIRDFLAVKKQKNERRTS